jgi:hypothetical protein
VEVIGSAERESGIFSGVSGSDQALNPARRNFEQTADLDSLPAQEITWGDGK